MGFSETVQGIFNFRRKKVGQSQANASEAAGGTETVRTKIDRAVAEYTSIMERTPLAEICGPLEPEALKNALLANLSLDDKDLDYFMDTMREYEITFKNMRVVKSTREMNACVQKIIDQDNLPGLNKMIPNLDDSRMGVRTLLESTGMTVLEAFELSKYVEARYLEVRKRLVDYEVGRFKRVLAQNPSPPDLNDPSTKPALRAQLVKNGLTQMEAYNAFPEGK